MECNMESYILTRKIKKLHLGSAIFMVKILLELLWGTHKFNWLFVYKTRNQKSGDVSIKVCKESRTWLIENAKWDLTDSQRLRSEAGHNIWRANLSECWCRFSRNGCTSKVNRCVLEPGSSGNFAQKWRYITDIDFGDKNVSTRMFPGFKNRNYLRIWSWSMVCM